MGRFSLKNDSLVNPEKLIEWFRKGFIRMKPKDAEIERKRQKMLELQALAYSGINEFMNGVIKETIVSLPLGDRYEVWIPAYATEYINEMGEEKLESLIKNIETTNNEKEDRMEFKDTIRWDYHGGIKKIDNHFLVRLGCEYHICEDLKEVARMIRKLLEKEYSKENEAQNLFSG